MAELIFQPSNWKVVSRDHCGDLWAMYFDQNQEKIVLVMKQGLLTVTVSFCCDESLLSDIVRTHSFYDIHVKKDVKVSGSDSVISLLNIKGKNLDLLQFLDGKGFMQNFKTSRRISPSCDLSDLMNFEEKEQSRSQNYLKKQIKSNCNGINLGNGSEPCSKTFTISEEISNRLYFQSKIGSLLNATGTHLLGIFIFESEKCVLLPFENGKLIFTLYGEFIRCGHKSVVYLPKKLVSVKKYCYNSCTGLVWTDGINLYLSEIEFDFDKPHFVKLVHFQIKDQVKGIKSIIQCNEYLSVVTLNRSCYVWEIDKLEVTEDIESSPDEFLLELHKCSMRINQLEKDLSSMTEFLKNKEMIEEGGFDVSSKGSQILLKSRVKGVLDKTYWKVRLLVKIRNKQHVEMKSFESDLSYGTTVKIESDFVVRGKVKVSLIGNFGREFQVLIVNLGCVGEESQDVKNKTISKNLYEIAQNRKICIKT